MTAVNQKWQNFESYLKQVPFRPVSASLRPPAGTYAAKLAKVPGSDQTALLLAPAGPERATCPVPAPQGFLLHGPGRQPRHKVLLQEQEADDDGDADHH